MSRADPTQVPARCPQCSATTTPGVWWCPQCYADLRPVKLTHQARHVRHGPADVAVRPDGRVTTDGHEASAAAEQMISQLATAYGSTSDPATTLGQRFTSRGSRALLGLLAASLLTVAFLTLFTLIGLLI